MSDSIVHGQNETGHSLLELRTLIDTSRLLVEANDLDFILNNLLLIAMGKVMVSKGMVLVRNRDGKAYTISKLKGRLPFKTGQEITIEANKSVVDSFSCTAENPEFPDFLKQAGLDCLFNIQTQNQHLGFMALGKKMQGVSMPEHERAFLESLVHLSAASIASSSIMEELKNTNRKLDLKLQEINTLFELSKDFSANINRDQIVRTFKFTLMGQMFVRSFFLVNKVEGKFYLVSHSGLKEMPDDGQLQQLFTLENERQPVNSEIKDAFPFLNNTDIAYLLRIKLQNKDAAVVGLGKRSGNKPFSDFDLDFLDSLSNLALLSIQKTYLLEQQLEKQRLEKELHLARDIQRKLLPDSIPVVDGLDIAAINISSREVGGDYYDLVLSKEGNLHATIADVTGKGVPASLIMANMQSMLHLLVPLGLGLSDSVGRINEIMYHNTPSDKFVTFFWACYNPQNSELEFVNAGHNPPIVYRISTGKLEFLKDGGPLIGIMPTFLPYIQRNIHLEPGDSLIMFTDGVTEAMSPNEEEYDDFRLEALIPKIHHLTAKEIMQAIIDDVNAFTKGVYSDDFTMIVIKRT